MYRHPIIQHVLNTAWFGKDTYARGHYFAPETKLPIVTIAFIATAIENALDAWKEGEFKRVDFRCKAYHEAYIEHLEELQAWKAYTANEPHDLATQLQVSLLETARCRIKGTGVVRHISEVDKREKKCARLERFGANQGSTSAS